MNSRHVRFLHVVRVISFSVLAVSAAVSPSAAETRLPVPTVEYSADRVTESKQGTFTERVYGAADRNRSEMQMPGGSDAATITLKNLQVGPQDPQLFEIPSGYTRMGGFAGMGGFSRGGGPKGMFGR